MWAGVAALDPYDTGRFAAPRRPGVHDQGPRTTRASQARDPAFDGAVIGNSHVQILRPDALAAATGVPFVSLTVPATSPREQFVMLDYLLRRRARPLRALVLGIDGEWCTPAVEATPRQPFPFWLYDPSPTAYLVGLVRPVALEAALQRVLVIAGLSGRARARPDGFDDYEVSRATSSARGRPNPLADSVPSSILNETGRFPQLDALGARLAGLPRETAVAIVLPPVFVSSLPAPGTALARSEAACRDAVAVAATRHTRTAIVDWRVDVAQTRDPANFWDHDHYRRALARLVERDVVNALAFPGAAHGPAGRDRGATP